MPAEPTKKLSEKEEDLSALIAQTGSDDDGIQRLIAAYRKVQAELDREAPKSKPKRLAYDPVRDVITQEVPHPAAAIPADHLSLTAMHVLAGIAIEGGIPTYAPPPPPPNPAYEAPAGIAIESGMLAYPPPPPAEGSMPIYAPPPALAPLAPPLQPATSYEPQPLTGFIHYDPAHDNYSSLNQAYRSDRRSFAPPPMLAPAPAASAFRELRPAPPANRTQPPIQLAPARGRKKSRQ